WVNRKDTRTQHTIIAYSTGGRSPLNLGLRGGRVNIESISEDSVIYRLSGGMTEIGSWHHILAAHDNDLGEIRLYVDGRVVASQDDLEGVANVTSSDLKLGRDHWNGTAKMSLDDVQIFNY